MRLDLKSLRHVPRRRTCWPSLAAAVASAIAVAFAVHLKSSGRSASLPPHLPASLPELLSTPPARLADVPIARMNLLCAQGLSGAGESDVGASLVVSEPWAKRVQSETARHWYRFRQNPAEYEHSEGFFLLKFLTPPEELAVFLSIRGMCLREANRLPEAAESFANAGRLAPDCQGYQLMQASLERNLGPSLEKPKTLANKL